MSLPRALAACKRTDFRIEAVMKTLSQHFSRRCFIAAAAPAIAGVAATRTAGQWVERGRFSSQDLPPAREELLKLVNEERAKSHLKPVALDPLACRVADDHAQDMARGDFLSHWGSDGRKPYQRYSFAGGTGAVRENVSSADNIPSATVSGVMAALAKMHQSMMDERPPNDGHRQTILAREVTHAGFGIGLEGMHLRLDEMFIARYLEIDPIKQEAKPGSSIRFGGRLITPRHEVTGVDIFFEPLPAPPEFNWLHTPRSYGLPREHTQLLPRLPQGYFYSNGSSGDIDIRGDRFRVSVPLSQKPGINTIVAWVRSIAGDPFPAAQVCVRVS